MRYSLSQPVGILNPFASLTTLLLQQGIPLTAHTAQSKTNFLIIFSAFKEFSHVADARQALFPYSL
jgi:hypothetical protein